MLVLTRKPGQSVFIGEDIKVTLHGIRGNQVRLGVEAPSHVKIYREEIYLQILEENKAASDAAGSLGNLEGFAKAWKEQKPTALATFTKRKPKAEEEDES